MAFYSDKKWRYVADLGRLFFPDTMWLNIPDPNNAVTYTDLKSLKEEALYSEEPLFAYLADTRERILKERTVLLWPYCRSPYDSIIITKWIA